jgi:inosine/xanthosine triphosphatase
LGNTIKLCIGSRNPAKIKGVVEAFSKYYVISEVRGKRVETGIPPQPVGLNTIIEGARRRAELCMHEDCDFAVGVEAGFVLVGDQPFDVEVVYIYTRSGEYSIGFSPSFPVPLRFYEGIVRGEYRELEEAVEEFFKVEGVGDREGFIGLLTKRICDRWVLSYYATLMALVKFINKELYS